MSRENMGLIYKQVQEIMEEGEDTKLLTNGLLGMELWQRG